MHEMSLAEGVVRICEDAARSQGFSRVKALWLEVGPMAGVELDALKFCMDVVTRGTLAQDARLEIVETEGRGWCLQCSRPVAIAARYEACPECGGYQVQVTGGDEMRVKELEVE
ncbi:MAG: hydrogenase maturation nickel metallochaperone HypA [Pseudomonadota bacterium]